MYNPADFCINNQVAIITAAGDGIGRAIAQTFAAAGAVVVVSDLDGGRADTVAAAIQAEGGRALAVACDVTNEQDLAGLVQAAVERFGRLTCVVANAGGGGPKPFDMPMADFRRAFELNVFSLFRLAQLAAPQMQKAGGGSVLAITSMAAENRNRRMASYGASKAAASHLVRNIAFDLGPLGIRVNGIAPWGNPHHGAVQCAQPRHRAQDARPHPDPAPGRAAGHGQCGTVAVFAGCRLGQRADPHRLRRRGAGAGSSVH